MERQETPWLVQVKVFLVGNVLHLLDQTFASVTLHISCHTWGNLELINRVMFVLRRAELGKGQRDAVPPTPPFPPSLTQPHLWLLCIM